MDNVSWYHCTITNPKNRCKRCAIKAYQDGKHIYLSVVCRAAKIAINVYGNMDSIINYVKKYEQLFAKLSRILLIDERYIFANIVECVDSVNRELKRGAKK